MKTIKHLLIILIAISLCSYSCGRKKCKSILPVPVEFRKYWSFTEGSWWVYKLKDTTDIFDTVIVISSTKEELPYYEEVDNCSKWYQVILSHSNNSIFQDYNKVEEYFENSNDNEIVYLYYGLSLFKQTAETVLYDGFPFSYPINLNQNNQGWSIIDTLSIEIDLETYENVIHTRYDSVDFYFAKNIGRVRFSFSDDMIWELVNYNIVSLN